MRCPSHPLVLPPNLLWFCLLLLVARAPASAQTPDSSRLPGLVSLGLGLQHGFIFPHSQAVQNTRGANPTGLELVLSWQRNDRAAWELCNCYPRSGLLLAYHDFDTPILGRGLTAAYFLEPVYRITRKTFFAFKGAAGLAYLNSPFDSLHNPANQSYSTAVSAYLLFGGGAWFRLGERWWLNPSVNYQHISNGGMKKPNKGINWPTAGLALSYQPRFRPYVTGPRSQEKFWQALPPRWDAGLLATARRGYDARGRRIRSPLAGVFLQGTRQVGRISNLNLTLEAYQDEELRNELQKNNLAASAVKAGLLAGHEFILGQFLFSQGLGYYLFDQTPFHDPVFHRWGLRYRAGRHLGLGFSLLAHRQVAEFIDFRVSYSWQRPATR